MLAAIKNAILHMFYPQVCMGCGKDSEDQSQLCLTCMHQLPATGFEQVADNPIEKVFYGRVPITRAAATFYFTQRSAIQRCLHELKYKGNKDIGRELGRWMGEKLLSSGRFDDIDILIPLPLHADKEKRRGYNQAEVIAAGIQEATKWTLETKALKRNSNTESQTKKSRIERWQNMHGKFEAVSLGLVAQKHILLIDDVITTGATLEAAATALLMEEGVKVSVATLCTAHQ